MVHFNWFIFNWILFTDQTFLSIISIFLLQCSWNNKAKKALSLCTLGQLLKPYRLLLYFNWIRPELVFNNFVQNWGFVSSKNCRLLFLARNRGREDCKFSSNLTLIPQFFLQLKFRPLRRTFYDKKWRKVYGEYLMVEWYRIYAENLLPLIWNVL